MANTFADKQIVANLLKILKIPDENIIDAHFEQSRNWRFFFHSCFVSEAV